jgi:hypothetical protein
MDKERLEELKKLCEDATPGPWEVDTNEPFTNDMVGVLSPTAKMYAVLFRDQETEDDAEIVSPSDAALIAASRTALPELIAEVEFLTKVAEQLLEYFTVTEITADGVCLSIGMAECWVYDSEDPELAQYLKRGKE